MSRDALESTKIMLTIPNIWAREIDKLVAAGYGKNRQAIIRDWIGDDVALLLQVEKLEQLPERTKQ